MKRATMRDRIEGSRVRLSSIRPKDSASLFRWINDRELVVFNAGFHPVHAAQHAAWMRGIVNRNDIVVFAIRQKRGDRRLPAAHDQSGAQKRRAADSDRRSQGARARLRRGGRPAAGRLRVSRSTAASWTS